MILFQDRPGFGVAQFEFWQRTSYPAPSTGVRSFHGFFTQGEAHSRSLLKAVSWRISGSVDTFVISLIVTGKIGIAGTIASVEVVTKIVLYYLHERVWGLIPWGR
jgi:uncharacterized membrane protein